MNFKPTFLLSLSLILLNFACSPYKRIPYFQDLDHGKTSQEPITNYTPLKIQAGDLLGINVSSVVTDVSKFNQSTNHVDGPTPDLGPAKNGNTNTDSYSANPIYGYRVDPGGDITYPYLGKVKAAGFTTEELKTQIAKKLEDYIKVPIVDVRILNFKITIMGDVARPDIYTIQNERITVPEALALAGDLNITAKRTNIVLMREADGKRMYYPIDLTSKKIFNQPYYYLKNNDVIFVDPDRIKYAPLDRGYRTVSLLISAFSIVAIILSAVLIQHK